ncbi:hypothetical protein [Keratinibaculum paraultunense]|nr:hypothetical protein [Keratinibaculum paraultunense]
MRTEIIIVTMLFVILVSLQHTLNKILVELRQIKEILIRKFQE